MIYLSENIVLIGVIFFIVCIVIGYLFSLKVRQDPQKTLKYAWFGLGFSIGVTLLIIVYYIILEL